MSSQRSGNTSATGEEGIERQQAAEYHQRLRHRFLGAVAVFFLAALLWQFGGALPPTPSVTMDSPVDQQVTAAILVQPDASPSLPRQEITLSPKTLITKPIDNTTFTAKAAVNVRSVAATLTSAISTVSPTTAVTSQTGNVLRLQVGAFSNKNNADKLATQLRAEQLSVSITKDKKLFIVRVENLPDKNAQQQAQKIADSLVAKSTVAAFHFAVQLATFSNRQRAQRQVAQLQKNNINASIKEIKREDASLFRVIVDGYRTKTAAKQALHDIQKKTGHTGHIIKLR